jgi:chromate transporter
MSESPVAALAWRLVTLSLLAIGGGNTILPALHDFVVETHGWMTGSEFAELYAIAQAAPGPNILVVTLIGWHIDGLVGAFVATLAMCGPSCLLTFVVARVAYRFTDERWWPAVRSGLASVTIGIVLAAAWILTRAADATLLAFVATGVTALVVLVARFNPLWLLAAGAALGLLGAS